MRPFPFWPLLATTLVALPLLFLLVATVVASGPERIGADYRLYMDAARAWLETGQFYPEWQLAGTYGMDPPPVLYPPYSLALFVPFTFLPAVLWWAVPIGLALYGLRHLRPAPWSWPLIVFGLLWPNSVWLAVSGNPVMWVVAAVAFGFRWPAAFALIKPSLAPFALVGIRDRRWWVVLAGFALVSLATLPMWPDYLTVLGNFESGRGLIYSLWDVPLVLVPVVAWTSRAGRRSLPVWRVHPRLRPAR